MEINLFNVKEEYGYESNWWKHIQSEDFGFFDHLQNMQAYPAEVNDILFLNQRAPEGYFEKFWFIVTPNGLERTDLSEVKEILKTSMVDFVQKCEKLPFGCFVYKEFKNKKIQINYEPDKFDKIVMKFSPGDSGIEDVQDFFGGLESITTNPAENVEVKKLDKSRKQNPKINQGPKLKLFPSGIRIVIKRGTIQNIEKIEQNYEGRVYYQYMLYLKEGIYELENEKEQNFKEVLAQISENLYEKIGPKIGDCIYCKGRTKNDWTFGDIVHNIRTLKIL
jgi:hypothetical protein